jgi:hypothetical protein
MIASFHRNGRLMIPRRVRSPTNEAINVFVSSGTEMNWNKPDPFC